MIKCVIHSRTQEKIVSKLQIADNFLLRLKGLMGTAQLAKHTGLLITPCQQVHTHFMRYSIDIIFLNKEYQVVHIERKMKPWKFSPYLKKANCVIEVNAGAAANVTVGDYLVVITQ